MSNDSNLKQEFSELVEQTKADFRKRMKRWGIRWAIGFGLIIVAIYYSAKLLWMSLCRHCYRRIVPAGNCCR